MRLQTSFYPHEITTASAAFSHTFKSEGVRGLYRGCIPLLFGACPTLGLCIFSYNSALRSISGDWKGSIGEVKDALTLSHIGVAGSVSALATSIVVGPAERLKILLQTVKGGSDRGIVSIVKRVYREQGLRAFSRGIGLTAGRDIVGNFVYFPAYEAVRRQAKRVSPELESNPLVILVAGGMSVSSFLPNLTVCSGFAGVSCWAVVFPIDTIKSRFQSSNKSLSSILQATRTSGFPSLYAGLSATLLRAFPASAGFFLGTELSRKLLDKVM